MVRHGISWHGAAALFPPLCKKPARENAIHPLAQAKGLSGGEAVKLFVPSESGMSRLPFIGLSPGLAYDSDHTLLDMRCRQRSEVFTPAQIQRTALTKPAPALQTWRHASAGRLRRRVGAHGSIRAAILENTENYRARARPARAATGQERA